MIKSVNVLDALQSEPFSDLKKRDRDWNENETAKKVKVSFFNRHLSEERIDQLKAIHQSRSSTALSFSVIHSCRQSNLAIINAIFGGNLSELRALLATRPDLQENIDALIEKDGKRLTCVHWAARAQKLDILRFLVEEMYAEIDVEEDQHNEWVPAIVRVLNEPVQGKTEEIVRYLVANEAALNDRFCGEDEWRTPVGYYAVRGDLNNLKILVRLGADVNIPDSKDETPVSQTIETLIKSSEPHQYGDLAETASYLMESGADLSFEGQILEDLIAYNLSEKRMSPEKTAALENVSQSLKKHMKRQGIV